VTKEKVTTSIGLLELLCLVVNQIATGKVGGASGYLSVDRTTSVTDDYTNWCT